MDQETASAPPHNLSGYFSLQKSSYSLKGAGWRGLARFSFCRFHIRLPSPYPARTPAVVLS
jgi:hypothetical protein